MDCIADRLLGGMDCILEAMEEVVAMSTMARTLPGSVIDCGLIVRDGDSYEIKMRRA